MRVKFFMVPALDPAEAESQVNAFLARHRVLSITSELVAENPGAYWAMNVTYQEKSAADVPRSKRGAIDYKEVLAPADFAIYSELRKLRKKESESRGVPPYAVFNNAQLAEMAQRRVHNKEELGAIGRAQRARGLSQRQRARQPQRQRRFSLVSSSRVAGGTLDPISRLSLGLSGRGRMSAGSRCGSRGAEASANLRRSPILEPR